MMLLFMAITVTQAQRMLQTMSQWNLYNDLSEKGSTIFKIIWDSVEQAVWGDELGGSAIPLLKPEAYVLLDQMLKDTNWSIADDIRTKNIVEDLKTQVTLGVEKATEKLLSLFCL